jgi:ADP-heptose:LPS heptosyltransferase
MEPDIKHLLVFRFSAMGDVALTVPVLRNILDNNKSIKITLVTNPAFVHFFFGIERLTLFPADFKGKYKGIKGLYLLFKDLQSSNKFNHLIDLHNVIRSRILSVFFSFAGLKSYRINKGRKEKREIITGKRKKKLIHTTERYLQVFENILPVTPLPSSPSIFFSKKALMEAAQFTQKENIPENRQWIGIAPMAKHELKRWSIANMQALMNLINKDSEVHFFLFGGGKDEKTALDKVSDETNNATNITGRFSLDTEIALISKMSFMITMDSANMHISSLIGVPTISVWGGTHPMTGFGALNQPEEYAFQISVEELSCRPCTIYGKGSCKRSDLACLTRLTPEIVFGKLEKLNLLKETENPSPD